MIVERFAVGIEKNLNLSVDFAIGKGLNGTFETNGSKEKPIAFISLTKARRSQRKTNLPISFSDILSDLRAFVRNIKLCK